MSLATEKECFNCKKKGHVLKRKKDLALAEGRPVSVDDSAVSCSTTALEQVFFPEGTMTTQSTTTMRNLSGPPLEVASGTRSIFSLHDGRSVSILYNEADVKFPVASVSEAVKQGNWCVFKMHSQVMWFWSKACAGWTGTTRLSKQTHSSVQFVRRRSWLGGQTSFWPHDADFHSEDFPNPVALDDGESQRDTRAKHVPPRVSQREFDLHQISHLLFRSWCDHCSRGQAREDAHPSRLDPGNDP